MIASRCANHLESCPNEELICVHIATSHSYACLGRVRLGRGGARVNVNNGQLASQTTKAEGIHQPRSKGVHQQYPRSTPEIANSAHPFQPDGIQQHHTHYPNNSPYYTEVLIHGLTTNLRIRVISAVEQGSPAWLAGVRSGDTIVRKFTNCVGVMRRNFSPA